MAIDDPIDAAQRQIDADERSLPSEWTQRLVHLVGKLPHPAKEIVAHLENAINKRRAQNHDYLLRTLVNELKYVTGRLQNVTAEHERFIQEEFAGLVVEAYDRAAQTRSKNRIARMAKIVAYAVEAGPKMSPDIADDMLRIASEVGELDVRVLRDLEATYRQLLGRVPASPNINDANSVWKVLQDSDKAYRSPEVYSTCAKLQSLGLVMAVERIPTSLDLDSIPFSLLPSGSTFLQYVRDNTKEG